MCTFDIVCLDLYFRIRIRINIYLLSVICSKKQHTRQARYSFQPTYSFLADFIYSLLGFVVQLSQQFAWICTFVMLVVCMDLHYCYASSLHACALLLCQQFAWICTFVIVCMDLLFCYRLLGCELLLCQNLHGFAFFIICMDLYFCNARSLHGFAF